METVKSRHRRKKHRSTKDMKQVSLEQIGARDLLDLTEDSNDSEFMEQSEPTYSRNTLRFMSSNVSHGEKLPKQKRIHLSAAQPSSLLEPCIWNWKCMLSLVVVTLLAFATRFHKLSEPAHVVWDETHFGKMGSYYINQTFFFDVHPPLGKMLIGLSGWLSGYDGSFPFKKPGDTYDAVPYIGMRAFCASMGSLLVPLSFCVVFVRCRSSMAALLAALLLTFDTGLLTLSQYILLDPILLFFIMASSLGLSMTSCSRPLSRRWFCCIFLTGVSLAAAISVKFVGLFVVLLAGFSTVLELWHYLGDLSLSIARWLLYFVAYAFCLIVTPISVYIAMFAVHFAVLSHSGTGDSFYSSSFQSQLIDNPLYNVCMPSHVAYGSVISLKNHRTAGAYLHSHWHLYPEGVGARQQQITTYAHKDVNNHWLVKPIDSDPQPGEPVQLLKNGDVLRLEHNVTGRNLHSHAVPAPLTPRHYQVTGYGDGGAGDFNDIFRIEMLGASKKASLETVRSVFHLVHVHSGCLLQSHNKQLPKWGFEQLEVTCNPRGQQAAGSKAQWNVEEIWDARLPNSSFEMYKPSFAEKLLESHAVMLQGNSGLKPKEGEVLSKPWQWPLNYMGQPFSGPDYRVYLLGNPVTWLLSTACLAVYIIIELYHALCQQRGYTNHSCEVAMYRRRMLGSCRWLFLGWFLHYIPFWTMGRILYFHHYFPALLYSFMLTATLLDYIYVCYCRIFENRWGQRIYYVLICISVCIVLCSFYVFSPLSYGMFGSKADNQSSMMYGLKWLDTWDI